jgi:hypothetical protein
LIHWITITLDQGRPRGLIFSNNAAKFLQVIYRPRVGWNVPWGEDACKYITFFIIIR